MWSASLLISVPLLALSMTPVRAESGPDEDREPLAFWLERLKGADRDQRIRAAREVHKWTIPEAIARRDPTRPDGRPLPPHEVAALVPALVAALRDPDPSVRESVVRALADLGPKAGGAGPAVCGLIGDEEPQVRSLTAWALGQLGLDPGKAVLDTLARALRDEVQAVRREAAYALGTLGSDAKGFAAALRTAADDPQVTVRVAARLALWRVTGQGEQVRLGLAEAAGHGEALLQAFTWLSSTGPSAVPVLLGQLKDRRARVRSLAAFALGEVRPPAEGAIPALVASLKDGDATVRQMAAYGLARMGPAAIATLPALRESLGDSDPKVREGAAEALKTIGGEAGGKPCNR